MVLSVFVDRNRVGFHSTPGILLSTSQVFPFTSHTEGYGCFKIPSLLRTSRGTLIAFSEARSPNCDDFDKTDVVYERSEDEGKTWYDLRVLVEANHDETGECGHNLVVGNIAPVQLRSDSKRYPCEFLFLIQEITSRYG